ncbi:MAG TPA: hypothetical protein VME23_12430 [Terracidiphilus sp.]|nr:hypothetical protein [Terracidiphilus sp.]
MIGNGNADTSADLPFPDPTQTVDDERLYYRKDRELIEKALTGTNRECWAYFGLRRYGKTCFLKRIVRICEQGLYGFSADQYRAELLSASLLPRENVSRLSRILASLKTGKGAVNTLLLIDDLQELSKHMASFAEDVESLSSQVAQFLDMASDKTSKLRLVLCEPTNFNDWLNEDPKGAGQMFKPILSHYAQPSQDCILPPFKPDEAQDLLSARVGDEPRVEGLSEQLAIALCLKFGGNPWLLSYAHRYVREGRKTPQHLDEIVSMVNREILERDNEEKLGSIYHSLSKQERFFLRLVYDAQKGGQQTEQYLNKYHDEHFTSQGRHIAQVIPLLGIVNGQLGHGPRLMPILREYLSNYLRGYQTYKGGHEEDLAVWGEVLTVEPPNSTRSCNFIIHQLSDLMLDASASDMGPWKAYLDELERLKTDAKGHPEKDCRPDLVAICGNTITMPCAGDEGCVCSDAYGETLAEARRELSKLQDFLRPQGNDVAASLKQILILPGIFDLDWTRAGSKDHGRHMYAREWRETFKDFSLAGERWESKAFNLQILPFDTTSIDGAFDHGGRGAVENLAAVRACLQEEFTRDRTLLLHPHNDVDQQLYRDAARRLAQLTMNYVVDVRDQAEFGKISDPTFKYRESRGEVLPRSDDVEPDSFVADSGFINSIERKWLSEQTRNEAEVRPAHRTVTMALTHHHPHLRRRGGVIEFYDGHDFRQQLVRAGIQLVLHGHSARQQVLSEKVSLKDEASMKSTSSTIELIGSGSFSTISGLASNFAAAEQPNVSEAPSFNRIAITRNPSLLDEPPQISVDFLEWESKGDRIVERGTVPVSIRLS